jgi:hypothetical protein
VALSEQVWQLQDGVLQCVEIHDTRDPVQNLAVANAMACFVPQGAGVKVIDKIVSVVDAEYVQNFFRSLNALLRLFSATSC